MAMLISWTDEINGGVDRQTLTGVESDLNVFSL